jgi:hypothetical protein
MEPGTRNQVLVSDFSSVFSNWNQNQQRLPKWVCAPTLIKLQIKIPMVTKRPQSKGRCCFTPGPKKKRKSKIYGENVSLI